MSKKTLGRGPSDDTPLAHALHDLATERAAANGYRQKRAADRIHRLAAPRMRAVIAHRLPGDTAKQDDAFQEAWLSLVTKSHHFRGHTDGEAFAWIRRIAFVRAIDQTRRKQKSADTPLSEIQDDHATGDPTHESVLIQSEEARRAAETFAAVEDAAVALVMTKEPDDLYALARKHGVGSKDATVRQYIAVWRAVRIDGRSALEIVAQRDGLTPRDIDRKRHQDRIAKQVSRGAYAVSLGAKVLLRTDTLAPDARDIVLRLRDLALAPQRKTPKAPSMTPLSATNAATNAATPGEDAQ